MLRQPLSTTFDTESTTSYGKESLSWSSWSTSSSSPDNDGLQTATFIEDCSDSDAASKSSDSDDYLHPACLALRSLSPTEKSLRKKASFIRGASDFGDFEDRCVASNRLEDVIQCSFDDKCQKFLVFSSSFPYHIEWANSEWSKVSGWSSDEIVGLDCQFLQGDATDKSQITKFWQDLSKSDGYASLEILNYNKYNTLHHNSLYCFPLIDNCGPADAPQVSHIAVVLTGSYEVHHSAECADLLEGRELEEVGMPLDRREGCGAYPYQNALPPPPLSNWLSLTDGLPLALMLRYMLRSQAPIVLLGSDERIVHVNVGWVLLTGYSAVECEGRSLSSFFDRFKDVDADFGYNHFQHVLSTLNAKAPPQSPTTAKPDKDKQENKLPQRDAHSPSSYETSNVYLVKKIKSATNNCVNAGGYTANEASPSSSPAAVSSLFPSPFGSPTISRKGSISCDSCEIRWDSNRVPTGIQGLRTQLSTVPIGTKHFAVLCIPLPQNRRGSYSINV